MSEPIRLSTPAAEVTIRQLKAEDQVLLSGRIVTARDTAHKWMVENFINHPPDEKSDDIEPYRKLRSILQGSFIYHCGPIARRDTQGNFKFVAAGPTTSIREEVYQADVIEHFGLRGVIGKGGMGQDTLDALSRSGAVYLHAIGGMGAYYAGCVSQVMEVFKLAFGIPEALWVIDVVDMPLLVSMDAHGNSLHTEIEGRTEQKLGELLDKVFVL